MARIHFGSGIVHIDFIDFIFLCFYHHLCNYCNFVFSDQSSNAVCSCLYRGCCYFNMYNTNQLTGNVYNDSEVTIKVKEDIRSCYAKYVFFLGKINNVIVSLFLLGLFTDRNDAFSYAFIYFSRTSAGEISTLLYTWNLKKVPLSRGASPYRLLCGQRHGIKSAIRSPFLAPCMTSGMKSFISCTRSVRSV